MAAKPCDLSIRKYQKAPVHHLLDMCTKFRKYILRGFVVKLRKRNVTDGQTDGTHFYIPRQLRWLAGGIITVHYIHLYIKAYPLQSFHKLQKWMKYFEDFPSISQTYLCRCVHLQCNQASRYSNKNQECLSMLRLNGKSSEKNIHWYLKKMKKQRLKRCGGKSEEEEIRISISCVDRIAERYMKSHLDCITRLQISTKL